jgi:hypothetical protein
VTHGLAVAVVALAPSGHTLLVQFDPTTGEQLAVQALPFTIVVAGLAPGLLHDTHERVLMFLHATATAGPMAVGVFPDSAAATAHMAAWTGPIALYAVLPAQHVVRGWQIRSSSGCFWVFFKVSGLFVCLVFCLFVCLFVCLFTCLFD